MTAIWELNGTHGLIECTVTHSLTRRHRHYRHSYSAYCHRYGSVADARYSSSRFSLVGSVRVVTREGNIEGNLRTIAGEDFYRCFSLQTTCSNIPSTVKRIESNTFDGYQSLEVIKFRNGLKYVGYSAFGSCDDLLAVELPLSTRSV